MDASHDQPPAAALRRLPAVDHLLNQPAISDLLDDYPRSEVVHVVRAVLDAQRAALLAGRTAAIDVPQLALQIRERLYQRARPSLRKVINATGIVLHTGLGRAPLAEEAVDAIADAAAGYCNLELDLESGRRGTRHVHARDLLRELTGAEDALVVNNNAAATYLAINTFGAEREAIISRGQLVEIGGSYRLPDIMAAARCRMIEVGTTNRTRSADYERAINDNTSILLRVHCSNYRIVGFTESTPLAQLVELARRHNLLLIDDLGSGLMTDDFPWPEPPTSEADSDEQESSPAPDTWDEPNIRDSVSGGADLTLFSGDKLLGGPQAGIIIGRARLIAALRDNPLARTFRPGKLTLAGLEATLRLYRDPAALLRRLPAYRFLSRTPQELQRTAHQLAQRLAELLPDAEIVSEPDDSEAGGGSLAAIPFPTWIVSVRFAAHSAENVAAALRHRELPIIARIRDDALLFDPRTLEDADLEQIPAAVTEILRELPSA